MTAPIVWPDSPTNSVIRPHPNDRNSIYSRPNSKFNRISSNEITAPNYADDRPQRLSNGFTDSPQNVFTSPYDRRGTSTVVPAIDTDARIGHRLRRKRPCIPVAKPHRYRDSRGRDLAQGKTLWDLNLYYLNLAPNPYLDPSNDENNNRPSYDSYGGYDCIPSYLYNGGGGGLFQNHHNYHQSSHGSHGSHGSHSSSHHTSSSTYGGQVDHDDYDAESGHRPPYSDSGHRPPYSDEPYRPGGGWFFGPGGLLDLQTWIPRPVGTGGAGSGVLGDEQTPVRPVTEINVGDIINNFVRRLLKQLNSVRHSYFVFVYFADGQLASSSGWRCQWRCDGICTAIIIRGLEIQSILMISSQSIRESKFICQISLRLNCKLKYIYSNTTKTHDIFINTKSFIFLITHIDGHEPTNNNNLIYNSSVCVRRLHAPHTHTLIALVIVPVEKQQSKRHYN